MNPARPPRMLIAIVTLAVATVGVPFLALPIATILLLRKPLRLGRFDRTFLLSAAAYVLMECVRREGLAGTELERAQVGTIRLKLLKIGAIVRVTVRRVWFSLAESCPYQAIFAQVFDHLRRWQLPRPEPAPA